MALLCVALVVELTLVQCLGGISWFSFSMILFILSSVSVGDFNRLGGILGSGDFVELFQGFPGGSDGKESVCNAGDMGSIPGSRRSPEEGHGNPLQYSCLENSMDKGAWWLKSMGLQRVRHD